MSDVLTANLMLKGLLFMFSTFPLLISGRKKVEIMIFNLEFLSSVSHLGLEVGSSELPK